MRRRAFGHLPGRRRTVLCVAVTRETCLANCDLPPLTKSFALRHALALNVVRVSDRLTVKHETACASLVHSSSCIPFLLRRVLALRAAYARRTPGSPDTRRACVGACGMLLSALRTGMVGAQSRAPDDSVAYE